MRGMKWHIYHTREDVPLCWGTRCLEFDSAKSAIRFVESLNDDIAKNATIKECIQYYDGGYINATRLIYDSALDSLREVKPV